jgi:hypothetical protein
LFKVRRFGMDRIDPGGVYRAVPVSSGAAAALVLVTALEKDRTVANVALLSPDVELGGSTDLVLSPGETGLAYSLLAQADLVGYLWAWQLVRRLASVPTVVLEAVSGLRNDDAVSRQVAGPPVASPQDPRWAFKTTELRRLQLLAGHCTGALVDGLV